MKTLDLELPRLRRHSDNARNRRAYTEKEVADLATSIREHGLLQPLVVKSDGDDYTILAGHRRHAALVALGRSVAPCVVLDADEQTSLAVLLGDNATHQVVDPLREASAVAKLVEGFADETHPYDRAAAVLGKCTSWVRARMRLTSLSDAWRKAREDRDGPIREWPVGHLELVAALPTAVQDEVLEEWTAFVEGVPLASEFRASLARATCDLARVPWDRDLVGLVDGAPACSACPMRASAQGVLFGDDSKGDRCLNAACFAAKHRSTVAARIVEARAKYGESLRVEVTHGLEDVPVPDGVRVHREFDLHPRAKTKGGFPVLRLRGLEVAYMAEARAASGDNERVGRPKRTGPKSLGDRHADLEKRRIVRALELLRGSLLGQAVEVGTEKHPEEITPPEPSVPALDDLVGLILAFGTEPGGRVRAECLHTDPMQPVVDRTLAQARAASPEAAQEALTGLWAMLRPVLAKALQPYPGMSIDAARDRAAVAEAICTAAGLSWAAAYLNPATVAIPEPRAWSAPRRVRRA